MNSKEILSFLQLTVAGLILCLAAGVLYSPSAQASSSIPECDNGNAPVSSNAWNRSEDRAVCYLQRKKTCPQGALWINASSSTDGWGRENGYYSTTVNVTATDNYVTVYLHGSGIDYYNQCAGDDFYAIQIGSNDTRLSISGSVLYRGRYDGYRSGWTGKGGSLQATLDVSEVRPGETKDLRLTICRRGADNPSSSTWRHGCEDVLVTVRKDQLRFSLMPAINTDKSSISTEEKDVTITTATVRNEGPNQSQTSAHTVLRFLAKNNAGNQLEGSIFGEGIDSSVGLGSNGWQCELAKKIAQSRGGVLDQSSCDVKYTQESDPSMPKDAIRDIGDRMREKVKDDIGGLASSPGDSLCYLTAVSNYTQDATMQRFRYAMKCLTVSKKPNVQVWGGDIKTDKDVITNKTSSANQNVYGSWGEYGIISNGKVDSSSGAGLSSSFNGRLGVTPREYNKLTFADTPKFGNFSATNSVPDNFTLPSIGEARGNISGNVDVNSLASGEYNAGNVTLTGSKLSVGKSIVIKSSGVVRISGDLLYTDTNDVRQLPQLIIYAKNIIIEPSVGEVNAWLITQKDGYVSTCGVVISARDWLNGVSESSCGKQQLKINGPIKTGRLFLRRTYGGKHASSAKNDPNMHPGTPAEIINLRADTYIWAYNNYRNTGAISTMNVRELPPRY